MDIKNFSYAVFKGLYDSVRGMVAVLSLDKEINERVLNRRSPTRSNSVRQKQFDPGEHTTKKHLKKEEMLMMIITFCSRESKVMKRIVQCSILNGGIFLLSILIFRYGLLPGLNKFLGLIFGQESFMGKLVWSWIEPTLSLIFRAVWEIPLFLLSKAVNALWCQDIADLAYRHSRGRPIYSQRVSVMIADTIFSMVIQFFFLIQGIILSYIPIYLVSTTLSFVHICLLYSLYSFEYKWFNMGWEIHRRLAFIEANWPYFLGFGIPMAFFTQLPDSWVISACVFSILFPFFIISGNEANPIMDSR
ncbi:hypothetical protein NQ317_008310 [Molorchus minor]|uniref:Etoposide-induced protein 2.4 n=1 Tax=Molorchus minor TaxID=1323400 RepID=A0ABQ9JCJ7_9CUCU|nr:hypothetical protein NQ317_008310 [Molorchus minor]